MFNYYVIVKYMQTDVWPASAILLGKCNFVHWTTRADTLPFQPLLIPPCQHWHNISRIIMKSARLQMLDQCIVWANITCWKKTPIEILTEFVMGIELVLMETLMVAVHLSW